MTWIFAEIGFKYFELSWIFVGAFCIGHLFPDILVWGFLLLHRILASDRRMPFCVGFRVSTQRAHDVVLTSIRRNDVVSTSFRRHVPAWKNQIEIQKMLFLFENMALKHSCWPIHLCLCARLLVYSSSLAQICFWRVSVLLFHKITCSCVHLFWQSTNFLLFLEYY